VTASALAPGPSVTVAFDGGLLNRPPGGAERPVKEALLIEYSGVYAPPPGVPLVNGDTAATAESLAYKIVRPSKVTAQLIGPGGTVHPVEDGAQHDPGTYPFTFSSFDAEGEWHWHVSATDDLGRTSQIDRAFRYDTTVRALVAPRLARGRAAIGFTLSRAAQVRLRIETEQRIVVRTLPPATLAAGAQRLVWDGMLQGGTPAYDGTYVAHVFATSAAGTSDLRVAFGFRRGAAR
jgi:hypothetical protein